MEVEGDRRTSRANEATHGVSFAEAAEVFDDPLHLSRLDERFDYVEERWITVGRTRRGDCTVVAHLSFDSTGEETIRIVSARRATAGERRQYELED